MSLSPMQGRRLIRYRLYARSCSLVIELAPAHGVFNANWFSGEEKDLTGEGRLEYKDGRYLHLIDYFAGLETSSTCGGFRLSRRVLGRTITWLGCSAAPDAHLNALSSKEGTPGFGA